MDLVYDTCQQESWKGILKYHSHFPLQVRVWDTGASSSSSSSACVGMTCVPGPPVAMKCDDALCYIAAGPLVTAIDLRTMRKAFIAAIHAPKLYSFEMLPGKWLSCTGGEDR